MPLHMCKQIILIQRMKGENNDFNIQQNQSFDCEKIFNTTRIKSSLSFFILIFSQLPDIYIQKKKAFQWNRNWQHRETMMR